jgi:hypothetical protein
MAKNKYKNLKKDKNGKWHYVDPELPLLAKLRIKEHFDYLNLCQTVQCDILGECKKTNNPKYWQYKNLYI